MPVIIEHILNIGLIKQPCIGIAGNQCLVVFPSKSTPCVGEFYVQHEKEGFLEG
jgi:hypothetical protein